MLKFLVGGIALAFAALPVGALAQSNYSSSPSGATVAPTSPNSGAGIPGQPGNKNGPAPKASTTGSGTNSGNVPLSKDDAAKVPGKAGGKSGPAVKPSGSTAK